jgi:outer membrane lipoprotein carrier protein
MRRRDRAGAPALLAALPTALLAALPTGVLAAPPTALLAGLLAAGSASAAPSGDAARPPAPANVARGAPPPAVAAPAAAAAKGARAALPPPIAAHCRARAATRTLRARFEQVRALTALGEEDRSRGVVLYRSPDALRWEYEAPDRSYTVVNGDRGWAVFPDLRQVQRFAVDATRRDGILATVGFGACGEAFADAFAFDVAQSTGGAVVVAMKPLRPELAASFSRVELTLDPNDHLPRTIVLHESGGDTIRLELSELQRGVRLDPALFEPRVPEGYAVVQ